MATMNISVPDQMKDWVQSRVSTGTYANTSDYLRDLIRQDQKNTTKLKALQEAVVQGLESGISPHSFDDIVNAARKSVNDNSVVS